VVKFADEALIEVRAGNGGNGCVAFRREKFVPRGGPAGGDGGKGGDVLFCIKRNLRTLAHLRYKRVFKAKNGADGQGSQKYGRDGEDVLIPLPPGSIIKDAETGEIIHEFTTETEAEVFTFLTGGKGGWGNVHFKSSTNQAPRTAYEGSLGETRKLKIELSIMADIGLVGFPNAGKSSLLEYFTNARPKIAPYPFTTKIPNLGVLRVSDEKDIIIADIPGIIEGASSGVGLGFTFLKHISRTAGLAFLIDCSDEQYLTAYDTLLYELKTYSKDLVQKRRIVLLNKIDLPGAAERAAELAQILKKEHPLDIILPISIKKKEGMGRVQEEMEAMVERMEENAALQTETSMGYTYVNYTQSQKKSSFLDSRASCSDETHQFPGSENE
jgi:GTP-binding protein